MQSVQFDEVLEDILRKDPRYARDSYHFVREALDHTQRKVHQDERFRLPDESRHVSGQQLLEGIREYALETLGPMAFFVLSEWGVRCSQDFGQIVFNLIDHGRGMFGKTDQDSLEDFKDGYSFEEAFLRPFRPARRSTPQQEMRGA